MPRKAKRRGSTDETGSSHPMSSVGLPRRLVSDERRIVSAHGQLERQAASDRRDGWAVFRPGSLVRSPTVHRPKPIEPDDAIARKRQDARAGKPPSSALACPEGTMVSAADAEGAAAWKDVDRRRWPRARDVPARGRAKTFRPRSFLRRHIGARCREIDEDRIERRRLVARLDAKPWCRMPKRPRPRSPKLCGSPPSVISSNDEARHGARASATVCPARTPKRRAASLTAPSSFLPSSASLAWPSCSFDDRERQIFASRRDSWRARTGDRAKRWRRCGDHGMFTPKRGACRPSSARGRRRAASTRSGGSCSRGRTFLWRSERTGFRGSRFRARCASMRGVRSCELPQRLVKRNSVVCVFSTASARRRGDL